MEFPEMLYQLRKKHQWSQAELAKKIGVAQSSINYWEKGERTPSIDACKKLADALNVSVIDLLDIKDRNEYHSLTDELSDQIRKLTGEQQKKLKQILFSIQDEGEKRGFDPLRNALREHYEKTNRARMNAAFDQLNENGQQTAADRVEELTKIPDYQKDDN